MEINTKFNIGDKVFYIHNNKLCKGVVRDIHVLVFPVGLKRNISISYSIRNSFNIEIADFFEKDLFETKEELINNLCYG
jgi:hypothetical protein